MIPVLLMLKKSLNLLKKRDDISDKLLRDYNVLHSERGYD